MLGLLRRRCVVNLCSLVFRRGARTMGDPIDHATGLEKRELLAKAAGDSNPFHMYVIKRQNGTEDCPNEIPSAFERRLVGCICEKDSTVINYMWLACDTPRRCECGYWFKLVPIAPL